MTEQTGPDWRADEVEPATQTAEGTSTAAQPSTAEGTSTAAQPRTDSTVGAATGGTDTGLERRYRRLLSAYPAGYRAARGDELVGTYLDLAAPGRRWPSPQDTADVLGGGLRQRLRERGALGLVAGLSVAARLSLGTLMALAAFMLIQLEFTKPPSHVVILDRAGPTQTLGAYVWFGWLLAGLATAVLPARWARRGVLAAIALTLAVIPASLLSGLPRPPLYVLVPVLAFGLTALALPTRPGWVGRVTPLLGALTGTAGAALFDVAEGGGDWFTSYNSTVEVLAMAGVVLVGLALVLGLGRAITGDSSALWSVVLLVTPASLLGIRPIADWYFSYSAATWAELAATTAVLPLLGAGLVLAVVGWHGARYRAIRARSASGPCPTCGHVPEVAEQTGTATPGTVT